MAKEPYFEALLNVTGKIAGVSRKKAGYGITVKFDRAYLNADNAADLFCGTIVKCIMAGEDSDPQQLKLFPDDHPRVEFHATCNGPSVRSEEFSVPLTIPLNETSITKLEEFAFQNVRLMVLESKPIEDEEDDGDYDDENFASNGSDEAAPDLGGSYADGTRMDDDDQAFYAQHLKDIGLSAALGKKLAKCGITTLGQLEAHRAKHGAFWGKHLPGIGPKAVDEIEDVVIKAVMARDKTQKELAKAKG